MKKVANIILCILISVGLVYWLFSGSGTKKADSATITVWHWMTDRNDAFQELAGRYEAQTGVKVRIDLFAPSDLYTKKITASTQANMLPDIFGILDTKKTFSDFIRYGYVANLTDEFQSNDSRWEKSLFDKALSFNRFEEGNGYGIDAGIYGVPLDVTTIQMLYNKKLLNKAGYKSPPKTFEEFIEVSRALKRVGIAGMVSGWGELWMVDCFASNYAFNIMGEEKIMATYRGEVPYTDKDWIKVFNIFKDLTENSMLVEGVITKPNKEAELDFALERAAFAFNGSWSVNVYHEMNPELEYGIMLPPAVNPDLPMKIWGGAGSSFVVNNNSPRKDRAIAFLKWLTSREQQEYLAKETKNLPSNREALAAIPEILEEFAGGMEHATHPTIWRMNEQPLVTERFTKGLQAIMLGKKTPEQVAREVQEVKIREIKRAARRRR